MPQSKPSVKALFSPANLPGLPSSSWILPATPDTKLRSSAGRADDVPPPWPAEPPGWGSSRAEAVADSTSGAGGDVGPSGGASSPPRSLKVISLLSLSWRCFHSRAARRRPFSAGTIETM